MNNKQPNKKECRNENCDIHFLPFKTTDAFCSAKCMFEHKSSRKSNETKRITPVRKVSKKREKESAQYRIRRLNFLAQPGNQRCQINGSNCSKKATTIEHSKGRQGFADEFAREINISLYLDERFWKPACLNCNLEMENNTELSHKHQLSKNHNGEKIRKTN